MISKISVKKPYTVLVGVLLVIVFGVVSLMRMTTDLLPDMSLQYALIITTDMGASPEKVEMEVTAPIEAAMATTTGIKNVGSMSYNSYSIVTCEYEQNVNMDSVVIEIQQNLDQLSGAWGDHIGAPMIMQINPDMLPVMTAAVDVEDMDALDLATYVSNELSPALESLEGVASVSTSGQLEETVVVTLNQKKIDAVNNLIQKEIKGEFIEPEEELENAIAEVEKGQQALKDGAGELNKVLDSALDGRDQLKEAKKQLEKKIDELKLQKKQLEETLATLGPKIDEVQKQRNDLKNQIESLKNTKTALEQAIPKMEEELAKLEEQIAVLKKNIQTPESIPTQTPEANVTEAPKPTAEVSQQPEPTEDASQQPAPTEEMTKQPESGDIAALWRKEPGVKIRPVERVGTGVPPTDALSQLAMLEAAKAELEKQLKEAKTNLAAVNAGYAQAVAGLEMMDKEIVKQFSALSAGGLVEIKTADDISKIKPAMQNAISQIDAGLVQLEDALTQLEAQAGQLPDALDTLNAEAVKAALEMGPAAAELSTAAASLAEAKNQLEEAKESALDAAAMDKVLTLDTLSGLITAQNFDMPAGYAYDNDTQYLVRVGEAVKSVEDLENLVLMDMGMENVGLLTIRDVADVEVLDNSDETYAIINGNPGIILSFEKQTGYSTGEVTDRLLEKFESLEKQKEGLRFSVLMDQGVFIDLIVNSVLENMIVGAILAILVLLAFLKDYRPTVVTACAIPLSVIVAVVLMYFTDISLNMISLSGLMLGIGMLVDNAIVVIENIYRLRNEGYSIRKACVEGTNQVAGAIVASTLTTISVYVPIIFTDGITRQLFIDLALTIAFTLTASLIVALTVVPAMSSFIMQKTKEIKTPWFDKISTGYGKLLETSLNKRWLVLLLTLVLLIVSGAACMSKGMTFMDMEMESNQLTVTIGPKEGEHFTFEELTASSDRVIETILDIEGIETIGATAGGSSTMNLMSGGSDTVTMYILLDEEADVKLSNVADEIRERTKNLECMVSTSSGSSDFTMLMGSGLSLEIKGSDLNMLQKLAAETAKILENTEGTVDVKDGLDDTTPQWTIRVDKEKAAAYGLTTAQVYQLIYKEMASTSSAATISTDLKDYAVYLQTEEQSELQLQDIKNLTYTYTNKEGEEEEIPLTDFCEMEETTTLSTIYRDAQTRYITVSCGIDADHNITLVSDEVQKKLDGMNIPEGYRIEMAGEDATINESMSQLGMMLLLAVIFIYLIMVAQFQSLKSPFIILFTIPLAFTGGFLALFFSGMELGVIGMLGFIMLAGVIVNNGIVLIDYINQLRMEGKDKRSAIIEAGITRLRPILMTALTTILAMSTAALGMGEGSEMMQPMAVTMVGGLTYGTLLTLFVIPCIYDLFNKEKNMVEEEL